MLSQKRFFFLFAGLVGIASAFVVKAEPVPYNEFMSRAKENQARYAREVAPHLDLTPYRNALPKISNEQAYALYVSGQKIVDEKTYLSHCDLETKTYGRSNHCAEIDKNDTPLYGHDSLSNKRIKSEAKKAGVSTWFYESPYYKPASNSQPTNRTAEYVGQQPDMTGYGNDQIYISIQRTLKGGR